MARGRRRSVHRLVVRGRGGRKLFSRTRVRKGGRRRKR